MTIHSELRNRDFGRCIALLFGLLLAVPAHAENLSWPACVAEAGMHNADLESARAKLDAAGYNISSARSAYYPQVSASLDYKDSSGSNNDQTYSSSLSVTQNLFNGFQDRAKVRQNTADKAGVQASLNLVKAQVSQALKDAFARLRYAQDSIVLTKKIVARQENNVSMVELRYESGKENKGSLLLVKAALAQARLSQLQATQASLTAQAQLAQTLGRDTEEDISISGTVPTSAPPAHKPDFRQLALQSPAYLQTVAQAQSASAGVDVARSGFYPSVNLTGSTTQSGNDSSMQNTDHYVGVSISVPLFSGGRDYYTSHSAIASLGAATFAKDSAMQQTLVNLKQAYTNFVLAVQQLEVNKAFLDAAEVRAEIARAQYGNGLISFTDWNLIENDLISKQTSYVQSQRDRIIAEAAWDLAQGKGVIP